VGSEQGGLDGRVQQQIGDIEGSVWDGKSSLDGKAQQMIGDRTLCVGDGWAGWMAGFIKRSASVHGVFWTEGAG